MNLRLLQAWVAECASRRGLVFDDLQRCENEYSIRWKRERNTLHVHLAADDCFPFFTERDDELPFSADRNLEPMRHALEKARLVDVTCGDDRIVTLHLRKTTPFNRDESLQLVLELIPRFGNFILIRDGRIFDALRTFTPAENPRRPIQPEQPYIPPDPPAQPIADTLPDLAGQTANACLEDRYFTRLFPQMTERLRNTVLGRLRKDLKKKQDKLLKQEVELHNAEDENRWRNYSELLRGIFTELKPSLQFIRVVDWFDPAQPEIEIPLTPGKSASDNIAAYARRARKAKSGKAAIIANLSHTRDEIGWLESRIAEVEAIDNYSALLEMQSEQALVHREKRTRTPFRRLPIDEHWEILIGRTSTENDLLTTRTARPEDWWFHCRIFHGTHVVLRNPGKTDPPEHLIRLCAALAAYYSQAKHSNRVPVDYTQIRFVRKPRGSVPGYVIYTHQKTFYADPMDLRAVAKTLGLHAGEDA